VLTVGSLFSGIGGLDLGLERAGMKVIWQAEIDPFCCKVLKKHWPDVPNMGNVTKLDWKTVPYVDLIAGGYPCQPFSTAGKRRGENDPRHLWPVMFNAIRNLRPRYALMENVRGHLSMGFGTVLGDLARIGFNAQWQVLPASAFGAPHRRDRVFIVAYPNSQRPRRTQIDATETEQPPLANVARRGETLADTNNTRNRTPERDLERQRQTGSTKRQHALHEFGGRGAILADTNGGRRKERKSETQPFSWFSGGGKRNDYATHWETEPDVGRLANGVPNRVDRLRGLGNAVVPQIAEFIGRLIIENSK
jgi:DNA (cytosine-5)-methyltransferase 1